MIKKTNKTEKQIFIESPQVQPELEGNDYILERQLKPEPRADVYKMLADLKIKPTAIIAVPSFILKLLEYAEQNKIDFLNSSIKKIICIGEPIRNDDFSFPIDDYWSYLRCFYRN